MSQNLEELKTKLDELEKLRLELYGKEAISKIEKDKEKNEKDNKIISEAKETKSVGDKNAKKGFIFAIISLIIPFLAFIALESLIKALKQKDLTNKKMAIAGLIISIITVLELTAFMVLIYVMPGFLGQIMQWFR